MALEWDTNVNASGAQGAQNDNFGWRAGNFWWNGAVNTPWIDGDDAIFGGVPGTVGVTGPSANTPQGTRADDVTFNVHGYILGGSGPLTLLGELAQNITTFGDATINAPLAGTEGFDKEGAATLTLGDAAHSITGPMNINAGTLVTKGGLGDDALILTMANVSGARLVIDNDFTVGALRGGGTTGGHVQLNGFGIITGGDNTSRTFDGRLTGVGHFVKIGTGTQTLSNTSSSYTGGIFLIGGAISVPSVNNSGVNSPLGNTGDITLGAGATPGTLIFSGNGADSTNRVFVLDDAGQINVASATGILTLNGSISNNDAAGVPGFTKTGPGVLVLNAANSYDNSDLAATAGQDSNTTISQGTLRLGNVDALPNHTRVSISSGAILDMASFGELFGSLTGAGSIINNGGLDIGSDNSTTATFSGSISGPGVLVKSGAGTQILRGANTYGGATTINAGALFASGGSAIPNASAMFVNNGATLLLQNSETIGALSGAGSVALGSSTLNTASGNTSSTFSGTFLAGSGALIKLGSGTLTLSGNNSAFTGGVTIAKGGAISVANVANSGFNSPLGAGGAIVLGDFASSGRLIFSAPSGHDLTDRPFSLGAGGGTFEVTGATLELIGAITGGSLTKQGNGLLWLTGNKAYTGATNINAGTLLLDGNVASSAVTISSGGTLRTQTSGYTTGALTLAGGTLTPGDSDGEARSMTSTNVTLNSGSFVVDIDSAAAYDRVFANGTVRLNGTVALTLNLDYDPVDFSDILRIVDNNGSDPAILNGSSARFSYNGNILEDGERFDVPINGAGNQRFEIRYGLAAGDNDVRLIAINEPLLLVVDTIADESDGNFVAGDLSLREAIELTNANGGVDEIRFAAELAGQSIVLGGQQLSIEDSLSIIGLGADQLTVDGNDLERRLFSIDDGNAGLLDVSIEGLTLTDAEAGGAIHNAERLSIRDCIIRDNAGGGIDNDGHIDLLRTLISENRTAGSQGGGGLFNGGSATIVETTFDDNSASSGSGGGVYHNGSSLVVVNSTFSHNFAHQGGGGLFVDSGAIFLANVTIAENDTGAGDGGGGLQIVDGDVSLNNVTIAGNRDAATAPSSPGGGIAKSGGTLTLRNSIVALNTSQNSAIEDVDPAVIDVAGLNFLGGDPMLAPLAFNGGSTKTMMPRSGSPVVDEGDNDHADQANLSIDQRGFNRIVDSDSGGTVTVDLGAVEAQPPVLGLGGTTSYQENAAPRVLVTAATLADPDSQNFDGGALSVVITIGFEAEDRLSIRHQGTAAEQIGVSGDQVLYENQVIGTFTGAAGDEVLFVQLNANATLIATQALIRNISYSSVSENPSTGHTISFWVSDGEGGTSNVATKLVNVTAVNDAPVITVGGTATYVENAAPLAIATAATVSDPDSANFDTGTLRVSIATGGHVDNRLQIANQGTGAGQIGVSGSDVTFEGTLIGTFTGGAGSTALVVTLNANATVAATQALARSITFYVVGDNPTAAPREVRFRLNDGDGGLSRVASTIVNITRQNDAPVLAGIEGTVGYTQNAAAIQLAPAATVTDADSADFAGGLLLVRIISGGNPSNRLEIGGTVFTVEGDNILRNGILIGTRNASGGTGTTRLEISLTESATPGIVQQLVRALRFRTVNGASTVQRVIEFSVTDGDGGVSNQVTKTVNLT